jgi:hypothetical protein
MQRILPMTVGPLIGAIVLVAAWALPEAWSGDALQAGATFVFESPDRWLAILGLGLVLGTQGHRSTVLGWTAFVSGAVLAVACRHSGSWQWITRASAYPYLHLLGPSACASSGMLLITEGRWRTRFLPVAAFAVAAVLLLPAAMNDPAPEGYAFCIGALLAALGLALVASTLRRLVAGTWTPIGERISGSWLLTIGLLLSVLQMIPAPLAGVTPLPTRAVSDGPQIPDVPDIAPAARSDPERAFMPAGESALPRGTN